MESLEKRVKDTKVTFKAKCLAQQPENGVLVILWREINPDCGNKSKCYIIGHEICSMEVTGPRGRESANVHMKNLFLFICSYSNGNAVVSKLF